MPQDHAAKTQVGAQIKQHPGVLGTDQSSPKGHHLHEAARARARNGIATKTTLDLDQAEHQQWIEPGALRLVVERAQKLHPMVIFWHRAQG